MRKAQQKSRFRLAFPTGRDSETFRDNGTEIPSLSRDKGTTGQAKNLAKGRDSQIWDETQNKTGQSRQRRSKTGKIWSFFELFLFILSWDVEEFVTGFFLLPLSRDKGTPGQDFFCPRTTERPVPLIWIWLNITDNFFHPHGLGSSDVWNCVCLFTFLKVLEPFWKKMGEFEFWIKIYFELNVNEIWIKLEGIWSVFF